MSATPPAKPPATDPTSYPERTEADYDAIFASVVWFRSDCPPEIVQKYLGMHVAILGKEIIDADRNEDELIRRLEALGGTINQNRIFVEYVPTIEEQWSY